MRKLPKLYVDSILGFTLVSTACMFAAMGCVFVAIRALKIHHDPASMEQWMYLGLSLAALSYLYGRCLYRESKLEGERRRQEGNPVTSTPG